MNTLNFILINIILPTGLCIVYSRSPAKQERNYVLTKSIWYLFYAIIITANYLWRIESPSVVGFAVTLAVFEGLPPILTAILGTKKI